MSILLNAHLAGFCVLDSKSLAVQHALAEAERLPKRLTPLSTACLLRRLHRAPASAKEPAIRLADGLLGASGCHRLTCCKDLETPALQGLAAALRKACEGLRAVCGSAEISGQWLLEARTPVAMTPMPVAL